MRFSITNTDEETDVLCPYCYKSVAVVHPRSISSVNQEEWIGEVNLLEEAYGEFELSAPRKWEALSCTGVCEKCSEKYLVFQLLILNQNALPDWWCEFHTQRLPFTATIQTFVCEQENSLGLFPRSWPGEITRSRNILVQRHYIGPLAKSSYQFQDERAGLLARNLRDAVAPTLDKVFKNCEVGLGTDTKGVHL